MNFVKTLVGGLKRLYHGREIRAAVSHYADRTGRDAGARQPYADSGSFGGQLDRLFTLGNAAETGELRNIATSVVSACVTNKYYRPADFLADVITALESRTYLSGEADGEAPLSELTDHERKLKLRQVVESWLTPMKVASVETLLEAFANIIGRSLPYAALARFERQTAWLFSLLEQSETRFMEQRLHEFLQTWSQSEALRTRFKEPAEGLRHVAQALEGRTPVQGTESLRVRGPGRPLRLSTVVPENRAHFLEAALAGLAATGPPPR